MTDRSNCEPGASIDVEIARFFDGIEPRPRRLLLAASGGPDSTALLHAITTRADRSIEISAIHVNHHLRGRESDADEQWTRSLCERLGVSLMVADGSLDEADVQRQGIEASARAIRYSLFRAARERVGADGVVTAHTRSDQAETVLLRLITGRGAWRLSGIRPVTADGTMRPLLSVSRSDILAYLFQHGIEARHDHSNDDSRFLRNRIRHQLLPLLEQWNPKIEEVLADTAALELERIEAFDDLLAPCRRELVKEEPSSSTLRTPEGASLHVLRTLLLEQIRRLDDDLREVDARVLLSMVGAKGGASRTISPRLRAECDPDRIRIKLVEKGAEQRGYSLPIQPGETIVVDEAGYEITLQEAAPDALVVSPDRLRQVIQIPSGSAPTFVIRSRLPGDRFRPLGMNQDKNLADFLIDRRIPVEDRDSLPLLVCDGSIVWVAGVEVGNDFRVSRRPGQRLEVVVERIGGVR
jgi:tRNA(Ile)-lysidine synthase